MKWAFWIFVAAYLFALFILLVGTFGWFGQAKDPLSGVFLMPLGLPWNVLGDRLGLGSVALAVLAPVVNIGLLFLLWRRFGK